MEHKIVIVGIGPGSPDYLPPVAKRAIDGAKTLVGSQRSLNTFASTDCETKIIDKDIAGVTSFIRRRLAMNDVVVLVSGDPGFYSMLSALRQEFSPSQLEVIPGISSVQTAFARLACPWQDATLVSLHGRKADDSLLQYTEGKKLGILTDGNHHPKVIAGLLLDKGWPSESRVCLCTNLSYESERIVTFTLGHTAQIDGFEHCVMVVMA